MSTPTPPGSGTEAPAVTVFIPTWNGGHELHETLEAVRAQELDRPFEIFVIDSSSNDGSWQLLDRLDVRRQRIAQRDFDHGATRNQAIREARGEIVALLSQDATPADAHWLQPLVDAFDDPRVAGAYSRQLPRADASPLIKSRLEAWAASRTERAEQHIASAEALEALPPLERMQRSIFDNVSSAVRRSVALELPFERRRFGEDIAWGRRAILAGHTLVFEPRSRVVHSHNRSSLYALRRTYLDHQNLHGLFDIRTVPDGATLRHSVRWELRTGLDAVREDPRLGPVGRLAWSARALPHAVAASLGQYLGGRSADALARRARAARWIDAWMARGV
ncbi:MAG: glycosyltransferase family 2 protein [Acidobacteriota bacterium]